MNCDFCGEPITKIQGFDMPDAGWPTYRYKKDGVPHPDVGEDADLYFCGARCSLEHHESLRNKDE